MKKMLYKILLRILQNSTSLNSYGNFDQELFNTFKKFMTNESILKKEEYIPSIINSIYFFIKLCNSFPSKIPSYINNKSFDFFVVRKIYF